MSRRQQKTAARRKPLKLSEPGTPASSSSSGNSTPMTMKTESCSDTPSNKASAVGTDSSPPVRSRTALLLLICPIAPRYQITCDTICYAILVTRITTCYEVGVTQIVRRAAYSTTVASSLVMSTNRVYLTPYLMTQSISLRVPDALPDDTYIPLQESPMSSSASLYESYDPANSEAPASESFPLHHQYSSAGVVDAAIPHARDERPSWARQGCFPSASAITHQTHPGFASSMTAEDFENALSNMQWSSSQSRYEADEIALPPMRGGIISDEFAFASLSPADLPMFLKLPSLRDIPFVEVCLIAMISVPL